MLSSSAGPIWLFGRLDKTTSQPDDYENPA